MFIEKKEIKSLLDQNLVGSEKKEIHLNINYKFGLIMNKLASKLNWKIYWFDYKNETTVEGEYWKGSFDPIKYKHYIYFTGDIDKKKNNVSFLTKYDERFPTRWLSEGLEMIDKEIEEEKIKNQLGVR